MIDKELKAEYEIFLDCLNKTNLVLENLLKTGLEAINKSRLKKENYSLLDEKFSHINDFYFDLKEILQRAQLLSFEKVEEKNKNNVIILPLYDDEDIYVYENESLADLWEKIKKEDPPL